MGTRPRPLSTLSRACSGVGQRPARDSREPLFLFELQGQPPGHPRQASLRAGRWPVGHSKLRLLLESITPEHGVMDDYEVEHEFPGLGHRTMCLNARQVFYERRRYDHSARHRGRHPAARLGTRNGGAATARGRRGNAASRLNNLPNHCQHHSDEGADGAIGRDAPSSARRSFAGHVERLCRSTSMHRGPKAGSANVALAHSWQVETVAGVHSRTDVRSTQIGPAAEDRGHTWRRRSWRLLGTPGRVVRAKCKRILTTKAEVR